MEKVNRENLSRITLNFDKRTVTMKDRSGNVETHDALLYSSNTNNGWTPEKKVQNIKTHNFDYKNGEAKLTVRYKDGVVSTATWKEIR